MVTESEAKSGMPRRAALSGWIGSVLEYYDFFIYATASALVFPQLFFPTQSPQIAIVFSLATYGVGYIMRPIGAFVLGHMGDTKGRKAVLILCMYLMGFSTLAVGLLPTYEQIGILAPLLLVLMRLIQGFAVAGEIVGASSMILEYAPHGKRGFYSSFALQGVSAGQLIAAAVYLPFAHFMSDETFLAWGWRIPFLASLIVIIIGVLIRRQVDESPVFRQERQEGQLTKAPISEAFRKGWKDIVRVTVMAAMNVVPAVTSIFGAAYAVQPAYGIEFSKDVYLWIPIIGNALAVITIPFVGKLTDRIGRRPPIIVGALACGLMSFVYLYMISQHNVAGAIIASLLMWGIFYQGYNGSFPSFFPELFSPRYRVTAMAIALNIGVALTSLLPSIFAVIAAPGTSNIPIIVGSITLAVTAAAALCAWLSPETYRVRTEDLGKKDAVAMSDHDYSIERASLRTR